MPSADWLERKLRGRIAELEEELRQAKEALVPVEMLPIEWRLSPGLQRALLALYHAPGGFLSHDAFYRAAALRWSPESEPADVSSQYAFHLRRRLALHGIEITLRYGLGYELTPAAGAIVKASLTEQRLN